MTSSNVTILIDSRDRPDGFNDRDLWAERSLSQTDPYTCLGGSWVQPETAINTRRFPFSGDFSFNGTGISFNGFVERTTLEPSGNTTFKAAVDDNPASNQTYAFFSASDSPVTQRPWYTSPILPDGQHSISLSQFPLEGVYIDYFTIGTGPLTPVNGQTIVMDDNDPVIKYFGQWNTFDGLYLAVNKDNNPYNYATPYGNSTHISSRVGDAIQIPFTGSSISVYGFLRWNTTGSVSLRFSLDDQPSEDRTFPLLGTSKPKEGTVVETNYPFYSLPSLSSGDHVLQINVTGVEGDMVFDLDMIAYKASFDTPQSMPVINVPALRILDAIPSTKKQSSIKGIVGGVIACFSILLIVAWCLFSKRRKRKRRSDNLGVDPFSVRIPRAQTIVTLPPSPSRSTSGTIMLSWNPIFGGVFVARGRSKPEADGPEPRGSLSRLRQPHPIMVERAVRNSRFVELERHYQELRRENEILHQRQVDPPPYEPVAGTMYPKTTNNEIAYL